MLLPAESPLQPASTIKDEDTIIDGQMTERSVGDQAYVEHVLPEKMRYNLAYLRVSFPWNIKIMFQTVFESAKIK